jgi:hypothetical protein
MARTTWQKGAPLGDSEQNRLRALIRERGEKLVAEVLGIAEICVIRGAAGCGLRRGTIRMIQLGLDEVEKSTRAA